MLEFYWAYATYEDLMEFTEEMISSLVFKLFNSYKVSYNEKEIDFSRPWKRLTMMDALKEFGGVDIESLLKSDKLLEFAKELGMESPEKEKKGKLITKIFEDICESHLIQPTFITDYPVEVSPLAKKSKTNPELTERFELYISGMEVANGFNELNDPEDQKSRFLEQLKEKEEGASMDEDYIVALEYGPSTHSRRGYWH